MAKTPRTDYELALAHRYVCAHGRQPGPSFSAVNGLLEPPALKWASSRIGAIEGLLAGRDPERAAELVAEARDSLHRRRNTLVTTFDDIGKVPWHQASEEELLVHWLRGSFDRAWKAKAADGTRFHDAAEEWAKGNAVDVLPRDAGRMDALERFYEECKPEWVHVERILLHPDPLGRDDLEYGGRGDWFAVLHAGPLQGMRCGDFKTGRHFMAPIGRQTAAYAGAAGLAVYDDAGALTTLEPLPAVDGAAALYVRDDGTYDLVDPWAEIPREVWWDQFLHLRAALNVELRVEEIEKAAKAASRKGEA